MAVLISCRMMADEEVVSANSEVASVVAASDTTAISHGTEVAVKFKPDEYLSGD
ncbi:hypothetical protein TSUD_56030 [Trifolium subterraneum]|uniref:Uncharacterized protein n=1 Tax=Trifolium subterraneum TaxID=3900 RepID=A0A2Z6MRT5_TRISU|nr:hypothetical protein TSUD_56030 [Trifolium subterraneum]